jgi:hypothetical protein
MIKILEKNKKRILKLGIFIFIILIFSNIVAGISLSPSELKIKNVRLDKNYQFILLITSNEEGLKSYELKSTQDYVKINPEKFMLSKGEKKSVKLAINFPNSIEEEGEIIIQPFSNNIQTKDKLIIKYTYDPSIDLNNENTNKKENEQPNSKITNYILPILSSLLILACLTTAILLIKNNLKNSNIKENKETKKRTKFKFIKSKNEKNKEKINRQIENQIRIIEHKINSTEKNISNLTHKAELFVESSDNWLKNNTGGKYGLE